MGHGRFWVKQAEKALSTKLCLPEKGDVGEIFAALYMLLCGDILRNKKDKEKSDPNSASFSVSMDEWFCLLKTGGKVVEKAAVAEPSASPNDSSLAESTESFMTSIACRTRGSVKKHADMANTANSLISFVQVCRNDFRSNSFCEKRILHHMYVSGLASYAYKNCKAIDIASSIKVVQDSKISYHPLLISVKNWATVSKGDVVGWLSSLMAFLKEMRQPEEQNWPSAVCLVILLGCSNPPDMEGDNLNSDNLQPFPLEDVYRLVTVPGSDEFGVSEAIRNLGAVSENCEIYSSHGFLGCEKNSKSLLRTNSKKQELIKDLFKALSVSGENNM